MEVIPCVGLEPDAEVTNTGSSAFSPATSTVPVGGVVRFSPTGPHNMTSEDDLFATPTSEIACLQFNEVGTYGFFCSVHPGMIGSIEVE